MTRGRAGGRPIPLNRDEDPVVLNDTLRRASGSVRRHGLFYYSIARPREEMGHGVGVLHGQQRGLGM